MVRPQPVQSLYHLAAVVKNERFDKCDALEVWSLHFNISLFPDINLTYTSLLSSLSSLYL